MVEDALRESLARGVGTEIGGETEGLHDREVGLDLVQGSTHTLLLGKDVATTTVEARVDTTHSVLGTCDIDEVDGLEEARLSGEHGSVDATTASGDDLSTTTVNGIGVKGDIMNVDTDTTDVLVAHRTFLGGPVESSDNRVFDFVQVLNSLGNINEHVGTIAIGTEAPDLTGLTGIPAELVGEDLTTLLLVITGTNLAILDSLRETRSEGLSSHVETVVLVGGLGQADLAGGLGNGLTVGDDRVGRVKLNTTAVLFAEILQANLEVKLTSTGDNVLTGLLNGALDHGVGFGETLKTFDELGQVGRVLGLDGNAHDGGDGELHDTDVMGNIGIRDGTGLEEVGVDTDETNGVTARDILNGLDIATHHENGTLDVLDEQIGLLAGNVVGAHDANLGTSSDGTTENTTESVEAALIGGGDHLGNVEHEGTVGVAVADGVGALVIHGTFVQVLNTVLLSGLGGGKVADEHFKKSLGSWEELAHDSFEEGLAKEILLLTLEDDVEGLEHLGVLLNLAVHDGIEELVDGFEDELSEGTSKGLTLLVDLLLGPLAGSGIVEVVTPKLAHHAILGDTELAGVHVGELGEGETPTVETGTEGNSSLGRVDLDVTEKLVLVGGNDDVGGFDGTGETLIGGLGIELKLEESAVHLVHHENRFDTLTKSLTEDSLSLDADTLDAIDDDKSTVSDTKGSSDFRGEIDVTGGINQVDQERISWNKIKTFPV